jgi:uncharacterized protein YmfQ (DUF2313 family)
MWIEYLIIALLALVLGYLLYKHIRLRDKFYQIQKELNSQTLDYYIKKINALGYDLTIKPAKGKKAKTTTSRKAKNQKSFNDLID